MEALGSNGSQPFKGPLNFVSIDSILFSVGDLKKGLPSLGYGRLITFLLPTRSVDPIKLREVSHYPLHRRLLLLAIERSNGSMSKYDRRSSSF